MIPLTAGTLSSQIHGDRKGTQNGACGGWEEGVRHSCLMDTELQSGMLKGADRGRWGQLCSRVNALSVPVLYIEKCLRGSLLHCTYHHKLSKLKK